MRILVFLQNCGNIAEKGIKVLVIFNLFLIAALINVSVFYRYVLGAPLSWSTELPEFLLVFTVLFAAAPAIRHDRFARLEALRDIMPEKIRSKVKTISVISIVIFLGICIYSPQELISKAEITGTLSPALRFPMVTAYRLLRIGFIAILAFILLGRVDSIISKRKEKEGVE